MNDCKKIQEYSWHPHSKDYYNVNWRKTNTLYIGARELNEIPCVMNKIGYGTFKFNKNSEKLLKLTCDNDSHITHWRSDALPWLDWDNKNANMSYHYGKKAKMRFVDGGGKRYFKAASRGQEFIVDDVDRKNLIWLSQLFTVAT